MLERAGGREFVHTLAEFVPAAANAAHYAGIVREQSVLRALIRVGNEIAELGYQHPGDGARSSTGASRRSSPSSSSGASPSSSTSRTSSSATSSIST